MDALITHDPTYLAIVNFKWIELIWMLYKVLPVQPAISCFFQYRYKINKSILTRYSFKKKKKKKVTNGFTLLYVVGSYNVEHEFQPCNENTIMTQFCLAIY